MNELTPWQRRRRGELGDAYHPVIEGRTATEQRGGRLPHDSMRVIEAVTVTEPLTEEEEHLAAVAEAMSRPYWPLPAKAPLWKQGVAALVFVPSFAIWLVGYLCALVGHGLVEAFRVVANPDLPEPRPRPANPKE